MGTGGDWADEWTEKSRQEARRMANRAVSRVFMIGPFCGEGLYNRVAWAGNVRERVRRFASYLLSKRSQKGKRSSKTGPVQFPQETKVCTTIAHCVPGRI